MPNPKRLIPACLLLLPACFLTASAALRSQQPSPPPEEPARQVLAAALLALGGAERLSSQDHWLIEGRGRENLSAELQGLKPDEATWRPHEEKLVVLRASGTVAWERRTPRNDESLRWRRFIYKPDGSGVVDWTTRRGAMRPGETPAARREALMRRIPHLLVLEAATRATRLTWLGERRIDGAPHQAIEAELPGGIELTLTFGREPAALRRVEYPLHFPGLGDTTVGWQWHGWTPDARLGLVPAGHRIDVGGTPFQEVEYTRYTPGAAEVPALLDIPAELRQPPTASAPAPPSAGPATGEVAPGVHIMSFRGLTVMIVEFRDFVVTVEAPETHPGLEAIPAAGQEAAGRVTQDYMTLLARTFPTKPVRYLILSHHHSDHLGGARGFAAAGATLLAAPGHAGAVRALLAAPHTIAPDAWSGTAREAKIETVAERYLITDGSRRLEVINVGDNPHTAENLFAWLPAERLLFQGDLFYYVDGDAFPPSGRATMNRFFAGWLRTHGLAPRAIYGVHNDGAAGPDALARALEGS